MAGHSIVWNGVNSSTIAGFVAGPITRQLLGERRNTYVPIPGLEGSWVFPEKSGRRGISVECFVFTPTFAARRDAVTEVADWLDSIDGDGQLILGDQTDVFYMATLDTVPDVDEWRELGKFSLRWLAQPYSYELTASTRTILATNNFYEAGHDYGIFADVYPVIEITPTNGDITEFHLTINGDTLAYEGLIEDDHTLTINGIASVVVQGTSGDTNLTGAYNPANLSMAGVSGHFARLVRGGNTLEFDVLSGTATTVTIVITWRKRYRK